MIRELHLSLLKLIPEFLTLTLKSSTSKSKGLNNQEGLLIEHKKQIKVSKGQDKNLKGYHSL